MRELPRQLSADELAELFEGRTRFVERLAREDDPLVHARTLVHALPYEEKVEVLAAHPAIGRRGGLSARSAAEQGSDDDPELLEELARLNAAYEERHGFRFVVFVNRRPKSEILDVLRLRITNPTDQELETALSELVAIAEDPLEARVILGIDPYVSGWLDLVFRWFHVTTAIVWIGTSFYFVALDQHLHEPREDRDRERGVGGESWEIHGGGFYRIEKFQVAPPQLPKPLHWYKWEAYWTWLTGFTLFVVLYYLQADTALIDPSVADLSTWEAILISLAGLALAWIVYDALCRTIGQRSEAALAVCIVGLVTLAAWGASELFPPRAAYLQVGAMLGTIMVANVFFVIIPAHWELVRAKEAGREPDPAANRRGKQRSVHNNYFTLPVLFAMLAGHFPFTYGHDHAWAILVCLMVIGAWVRHYFNNRHAGRTLWWIPVTAAAGIAAVAVWIRPTSTAPAAGAPAVTFAQVHPIVTQRCAACHSAHPTLVAAAPLGIVLDTAEQIHAQAARIKAVAVDTHVMPLGNATRMTDAERKLLGDWIDAGAKTP